MDRTRARGVLVSIGGIGLVVGSLLPWGVFETVRVSGLEDGDGWMTLLGGIALIVSGYALSRHSSVPPPWVGWTGAVLGLLVTALNLLEFSEGPYAIGIGLWLMLGSGALGTYGLLRGA